MFCKGSTGARFHRVLRQLYRAGMSILQAKKAEGGEDAAMEAKDEEQGFQA